MIALRIAAIVASLVTITLNAAYGFKTSAVLEYAVLFATLNATLDVAKCACLVGASRAWQAGRPVAAIILFLLFWPLLANSLWCGLSEVAFNRAGEQSHFATATRTRALADETHKRAAKELADLEANRAYKASTACALPRNSSERTLCAKHADATRRMQEAAGTLTHHPTNDPAPQITLLASWTGYDRPLLLLAAALWPIVLAELCGSVGFYLSATPHRAKQRQKRFKPREQPSPHFPPKNASMPPAGAVGSIHWPAIKS